MSITRPLIIGTLMAAAILSGCKTNLLGGESPVPIQPQTPAAPVVVEGMRTSYADIVERTSPAVVRIVAEIKEKPASQTQFPGGDDFFRQFQIPQQQPNRRPQVERGVGSGVIVSADGSILTNHHVVDGATKITVLMSDNKSYEAKIVGSDQPSDLAVLKIEAENLPFLTLGNSDTVRVGDIVLAIGNPLGIGQSVTSGIISAKGRRTGLSDGSFEDFLQTDAPINRGNSGGALVSLNGELIGINSQILSGGAGGGNIGIAFSIPSNMAKSVMEQLIKDGKVRRGMLGVNIQNITDELAKSLELEQRSGVIVSNVRQGSAADKGGVKRNDLILAINGEKIEDSNVLRNKVAGTAPGTTIKLTVLRDGKEVTLDVTLDEFDTENARGPRPTGDENAPGPQNQSGKLGLNLEPVTPQIAKQLGLDSDKEGMVVTEVDPDGPAAEEGVARGDCILEINKKQVNSIGDVQAALAASGERPVLLLISRRGQTIYLTVKPQ
ncbi:MAG: DegQ family serine endoprotease [Acidobacteria bacterium]|nr:DegQ family serine endoprotease [Acidobacteriota bacterium]MBK9529936.1 DegQ family serine endoprotease [Acidobacteriota bacterium]MBP7475263.1 DegQ family serine endoprotease [Pyrinomonadaceae bacterium]MBP9110429.1 DegQ family serine endoprotease [Pyrinomonadaceae bacterium]